MCIPFSLLHMSKDSSIFDMKILPSPLAPVQAVFVMASIILSTFSSSTTVTKTFLAKNCPTNGGSASPCPCVPRARL